MKFFRTHITQTFSVTLLLTGILFYFLKPAGLSEKQDAFSIWLQSNLKTDSNTKVIDQIRGLSASQDEFESVLRKASVLVKDHADDFELPVNEQSQDENEVYQLLLKEWNFYQNSSSGMGKAIFIKQAQSHSVLPVDGLAFHLSTLAIKHQLSFFASGEKFQKRTPIDYNYHISPLSGGTAIGAP